jgi:hypothetical protein
LGHLLSRSQSIPLGGTPPLNPPLLSAVAGNNNKKTAAGNDENKAAAGNNKILRTWSGAGHAYIQSARGMDSFIHHGSFEQVAQKSWLKKLTNMDMSVDQYFPFHKKTFSFSPYFIRQQQDVQGGTSFACPLHPPLVSLLPLSPRGF